MLPLHFAKFWYPEALHVFIRVWSNLISIIEEDLAVGLMWKLLFVPLFHDATFFGRIMSFFFRLFRVLTGLFAFILISLVLSILAIGWFVTPVGLLFSLLGNFNSGFADLRWLNLAFPVFVFGAGLFVNHLMQRPLKKVWQIKKIEDIWACTHLKRSEINFLDLLPQNEVKKLLNLLELDTVTFKPDMLLFDEKKFLDKVLQLARQNQAPFITPGYFFVALLQFVPDLESELLKSDLKVLDFERALKYAELERAHWRMVFIWDDDFSIKHLKGTNRGWLGAPTPNLDLVSEDLTKKASREYFENFVGRELIQNEVVRILTQTTDRNVMLIGEPGSGRSTLVKYLAKRIVTGDAPEVLATKRLVRIDLAKLLSGVSHEGEAAERIKNAFDEVVNIENIILYFDEFHTVGVGEAAVSFNLMALIAPYLDSAKMQFIASTDEANYTKILEKNGEIARLFHKVEVEPANHDETLEILTGRAIDKARYEKVTFTFLALKEILEKSETLIHDRVLPDSALYIFTEAASLGIKVVKSGDVKKLIGERIHIPISELNTDQKGLLLNLEKVIHDRMIGQDQAVKMISDTLRRSAAQIREKARPIGSFLFVGPTGVGKTELSKILAEIYFKTKDAFIRYDMSEYQSREAVDRLIGTDSRPGELTEAVKHKPYALILLDEFEKADHGLLNLFLQVLDDGRLTGGDGKTVDFTNTIIIATSNAGSLQIAQGLEQNKDIKIIEAEVKEELLRVFKPELINRFDNLVIFEPLNQKNLEQIVQIRLKELQVMMKEQGYEIDFNDDLIRLLAIKGFDKVMGARPLRRLLQDTLESKLSKMILEGSLRKGQRSLISASFIESF